MMFPGSIAVARHGLILVSEVGLESLQRSADDHLFAKRSLEAMGSDLMISDFVL